MRFRPSPLALAVISVFIAGFLYFFTKTLMNAGMTPLEVAAIRQIGTALMFAVILLVFDREAFRVRPKDLPMFALFAVFNVLSNLAMFTSLEYIPLGMAAVLQMTSPYFVLVLSLVLFGIRITLHKVVACMVVLIGCVLIVGVLDGVGDICVTGILLAVGSAVFLAIFTIGGRFVGNRDYSENTAMMYFFGFSGLMFLPLADFGKIGSMFATDPSLLAHSLCMCFVCTLVINFLIIYTTRRMDPGVYSIIFSSCIVVSTLIGIVFFGESITVVGVIGIVLVLAAMVILEWESVMRVVNGRRQRT